MAAYTITGVGGLASSTHNPFPPVELGRAGGTVVSLTVVGDGTSGATDQTDLAVTSDGNGTGLTVDSTTAAGVVTALAVAAGGDGGDGYRLGELVTVTGNSGGSTAVTAYVSALQYTN